MLNDKYPQFGCSRHPTDSHSTGAACALWCQIGDHRVHGEGAGQPGGWALPSSWRCRTAASRLRKRGPGLRSHQTALPPRLHEAYEASGRPYRRCLKVRRPSAHAEKYK